MLGEEQGRVQRVPDPGASINRDGGGKERSGVNALVRRLFAEESPLKIERKKEKHWGPDPYRI